jgi:hypothetical protein
MKTAAPRKTKKDLKRHNLIFKKNKLVHSFMTDSANPLFRLAHNSLNAKRITAKNH